MLVYLYESCHRQTCCNFSNLLFAVHLSHCVPLLANECLIVTGELLWIDRWSPVRVLWLALTNKKAIKKAHILILLACSSPKSSPPWHLRCMWALSQCRVIFGCVFCDGIIVWCKFGSRATFRLGRLGHSENNFYFQLSSITWLLHDCELLYLIQSKLPLYLVEWSSHMVSASDGHGNSDP